MASQLVHFNISTLDIVIRFSVIAVLFGILIKTLLPQQSFNSNDISELYIVTSKMIGYGMLATYIYYYLHTNSISKVDALTFFTFTLATLEFCHCLFIFASDSVSSLIKYFFKSDRN